MASGIQSASLTPVLVRDDNRLIHCVLIADHSGLSAVAPAPSPRPTVLRSPGRKSGSTNFFPPSPSKEQAPVVILAGPTTEHHLDTLAQHFQSQLRAIALRLELD